MPLSPLRFVGPFDASAMRKRHVVCEVPVVTMNGKDTGANAALLRYLVGGGRLANDVAQAAEAELGVNGNGASVIDWLVRRGLTTENDLAGWLAKSLRLPVVDVASIALDPNVTAVVREEFASQYQIVPVGLTGQTLIVAMSNPLDRAAIRAVEFATGKRVDVVVATQTAIRDALEHAYHLDDSLDAYLQGVPDESVHPIAEQRHEAAPDLRSLMRETKLAPVVKLFNSILMEGVRTRASDIHIEPGANGLRVRYRVDGILEESLRIPKWVQDPLTARCKVLAKLDITERRIPQDGRLQIRHRDATIDLRVSSLPTQFGEKVTMRVLGSSGAPSGLDGFGFSPRDLQCIRHAINRPEGMILVTGPTGSGKTTTLYGMIAEIVSPMRNIVTIENPIEYQIGGINQVEINEKQGLTFASTLRSILRQDPDVILVGEIRDAETAEIAMRAAQTGHLVLSTLHTNDAVSTITRLIDLGIEPFMLASSLHVVIAQRLVRRICEHCAAPYQPNPDGLRALQIDATGREFRSGQRCVTCHQSGYAGRSGVFEVMAVTPSLAKLVETKAAESVLRMQARHDGTTLLAMDAAARVLAGTTTVEEVLRVVDVAPQAACPSCSRAVEETFAVCPHCATALRCSCSNCGMALQKEWQTCPYCAASVQRAVTPAAGARRAAPVAATEAQGYRALVVDDHADMRRLVALTLEQSDLSITTVTASNGSEALQQAQTNPPHVIVLDIMMPGMDGFAVCEQLRANVRTAFIPILMLTALDDPGNRARGYLTGTDDYIGKPFARTDLLVRVRRLLERTYGAVLPRTAIESFETASNATVQ